MSTLATYILYPEVKQIWRSRYASNGYFVIWANQLLEELDERGFLPTSRKDIGAIPHDYYWIDKPSDLITLEKIYDPSDPQHTYRIEDINNKFKLMDVEFEESTESISADVFTAFAVDSVTTNLADLEENDLEGYLMVITEGDRAGQTFVLSGNDATSVIGGTSRKVYLLHHLDAAFVADDITEAYFYPPAEYVIIRYVAKTTEISDTTDEFPIPDDCEKRLVPVWLRWCCEREAAAVSDETIYWQAEKDKILWSLQAKRNARVNVSKGRRLVGMENTGFSDKIHVDYSELG